MTEYHSQKLRKETVLGRLLVRGHSSRELNEGREKAAMQMCVGTF